MTLAPRIQAWLTELVSNAPVSLAVDESMQSCEVLNEAVAGRGSILGRFEGGMPGPNACI